MVKLWILYPGYVRSRNDRERHYVGFHQLRELYGLKREQCVNGQVVVDKGYKQRGPRDIPGLPDDQIAGVLYPRWDGRYRNPETYES